MMPTYGKQKVVLLWNTGNSLFDAKSAISSNLGGQLCATQDNFLVMKHHNRSQNFAAPSASESDEEEQQDALDHKIRSQKIVRESISE